MASRSGGGGEGGGRAPGGKGGSRGRRAVKSTRSVIQSEKPSPARGSPPIVYEPAQPASWEQGPVQLQPKGRQE